MRHYIVFILTLLAAVLVGCESEEPSSTASVDPPAAQVDVRRTTAGRINTVDRVPGFPPFSDPLPMLEVVEDRGDTVVVAHQFGETEIPKSPERVFADAAMLPVALVLDLPVVGAYYWAGIEQIPTWDEQTEGVVLEPVVEYTYNFEFIVSLEPDVILAFSHIVYGSADQQLVYDQLSAIAPTVVLADDPVEYWWESAGELGHVFELDEERVATIERAGESIAGACAPLQEAIGDGTVIVIQTIGDQVFLIGPGYENGDRYTPYSLTSYLYFFCGIRAPANLYDLVGLNSGVPLSTELIPALQADHLFLFINGAHDDLTTAELLDNPLWQAVPAVRNNRVYPMLDVAAISYDMTLVAIDAVVDAVTSTGE